MSSISTIQTISCDIANLQPRKDLSHKLMLENFDLSWASLSLSKTLMHVVIITSKNEHDWTPVKYLNVLHQNGTQKQMRHFFC